MSNKTLLAWLTLLLIGLMAGIHTCTAQAAFPHDMKDRPLWAHSINYDKILVYEDENLENVKESVDGPGFLLVATMASEKGLFGSYEDGDIIRHGWFDQRDFIEDPDFEEEYATVRAPMVIYTDESFDERRDTIKKYSGVIAVSAYGDNRQVIYEKKGHYETGWMTGSAYSDTLIYDGRKKQILRNGVYEIRNGYLDNKKGGEKDQPYLEEYPSIEVRLTHYEDDYYYIQKEETGEYLNISGEGNIPVWTSQESPQDGLFAFHRNSGSFVIQSRKTRTYLTQYTGGELHMTLDSTTFLAHWRVQANKKVQDKKDPFVITQYDPEWCATPYGDGGCMGTAGCGVLAPVNAVYALTGEYMDVMELADLAVDKGYRIVDNGTDEGIFKESAKVLGKKYGFAWDGASGDINVLKKKLNKGDVAVIHVQGHYVAVTAYDRSKKKFLMLDSNYLPKREDTPFGDWISTRRLLEGALEMQTAHFFRLRDMNEKPEPAKTAKSKKKSGTVKKQSKKN